MADAIISVVVERVTAIIEEQIRNEVNLVRGVEKEVLNLSNELKTITNLLDDADRRGFKEKSIKDWLKRLEDTSYEMDDVLDEWDIAISRFKMEHESKVAVAHKHKVCPSILSSCLCFKKVVVRRDIAKKILNVKEQLDQILAEKDRYKFLMSQPTADPSPQSWRPQSTSFVDIAEVHGRDSDRDSLVRKLMANAGRQDELGIQILSIVGAGGIGKTTLAQLLYNNSQVKDCFELRIWVCVSDPFDEVEIAKRIVESVRKERSQDTNNLEMLLQYVTESVSGKKFLLVLDDVWKHDHAKWKPLENSLKCGGAGSKILLTTRNVGVAEMMGTKHNEMCLLGELSNEDCWLLLCRIALFGRNEEEFEKFQDIGQKIANKCKGFPLAAKTLGSLLRFKNSLEEWENVLNSEIWQLKEAQVELFPHLLLSYNELSPTLKRCFSYCAVFPKDFEIDVEKLIGNWMALGYLGSNGDLELRGREYFEILAMRSLFQDFEKDDLGGKILECKMHDIVHDFAEFLRRNGRVETARMKKTTCQACNPLLVSHVKEYRSLFCDNDEQPPNLCECLASLRVLYLAHCGLRSIPQGMENLIHLRWLDLSNNDLSGGDLKTICELYNLQNLLLCHCRLEEIPWEIGNLIHLRHLDLSHNYSLKELPESICGLHELRTLNVDKCRGLCGLPEEIRRLTKLKHLHNRRTSSLRQLPQGIAQLTDLRTLTEFRGGSGWSKLGLLKNLNRLSGYLRLCVRLTDDDLEDVAEDAREAELRKKIHIQKLTIIFSDRMIEEESSSVRMDVIDALEPHSNLQKLVIEDYKGSKLPGWIAASPLNQLRSIYLEGFNHLSLLPPLGKLQCLEEILIKGMSELEFVGREFLGIATTIGGGMDIQSSSSSSSVAAAATNTIIAFPKLKKLTFYNCPKWKEWEDITAEEEEESAAVSLMPCLTELYIENCKGLKALPHRLLRKASSLEMLNISGSTQLQQRYGDKDGSAWKSISQNNPRLRLLRFSLIYAL